MPQKIKKDVEHLVDMLENDYKGGRDIDIKDTFVHPDKNTVIKLLSRIRGLIFPSYFGSEDYHVYTKRTELSMQLEDVLYNLTNQISLVLKYLPKYENADEKELSDEAEKLALEFLSRLPKIRALIDKDLDAAYHGDPAAFNKPEIVFSYPGLFAIAVNRIAHELHTLGVPLIPRIMTEYAHTETGIDIHPGATLGEYFFIDHGTGIVIGETAVIGDRVKIYQGVTIGALSTRGGQKLNGKKRHPTIESGVTIYANASILGGDTVIGHDSVIGGNAFITSSIPPCTRVRVKSPELEYRQSSSCIEANKCGVEESV